MQKMYFIIQVSCMLVRLLVLKYSVTTTMIGWLVILNSKKLENLLPENTFG